MIGKWTWSIHLEKIIEGDKIFWKKSLIHNIFISHKHTDHLFGLIWIYRFIDLFMRKGIYEGNLNIWCNDELSKNNKQYGFKTILNNGKTLVFHGDEPLNKELYDFVRNSDYLLHESYCLETEANIYEPRKRNHDTVKSVGLKAQNLGIKNLVIWHTLENLGKDRKNRYMKEAKENFSGNVFVPNDLEIIDL